MNSRKPDVVDAVKALHPTAQFTTNTGKIDEWHSSDITQPTEDEINTKLTELTNVFPMKLLREERDRLLKETDWRASSDLTLSNDWKTYRQALRDLPSKSGISPKLNSNDDLDMSSVTWPTPPS